MFAHNIRIRSLVIWQWRLNLWHVVLWNWETVLLSSLYLVVSMEINKRRYYWSKLYIPINIFCLKSWSSVTASRFLNLKGAHITVPRRALKITEMKLFFKQRSSADNFLLSGLMLWDTPYLNPSIILELALSPGIRLLLIFLSRQLSAKNTHVFGDWLLSAGLLGPLDSPANLSDISIFEQKLWTLPSLSF